MITLGHCLCQKTRWEFEGAPNKEYYCHCDDCRRNCAAPITAWIEVSRNHFRWTGHPPKRYESSQGCWRYFCEHCGSPMGFEAERYAEFMYLYAASMQTPSSFKPSFHVNCESKLPWLDIHDNLDRYDGLLLNVPTLE